MSARTATCKAMILPSSCSIRVRASASINEFMAGAFRLKLGNLNRKGVTPATQAPVSVDQPATENVAT